MIAYGMKTWKSIAMPAVLFLGLSVFLFLHAVQMNLKICDEVKEYGRITCFINEAADERILEQVVSRVIASDKDSFVYELPVMIHSNSISKEYNVTGIDTQMVPGSLISGRYYADNVSTLELMMNMAAFSDLTGANAAKLTEADDEKLTGISDEKMRAVESWMGRTLIMGNCGAKICGIVEDGSKTPSIYISVPAAESYLKQQGETPKASSYCVGISDLKTLMKTQEQMNEMGIATSVDDGKLFQWKLMEFRRRDFWLMGSIALAGYVSCIVLAMKMRMYLDKEQKTGVYVVWTAMSLAVGSIIGVLVYLFVSLWTS